MSILMRGNDALKVNPPVEDFALTTHGSDWLWAVTAAYGLMLIMVIGLSYSAPKGEKVFHYLFTISLLTGAIAYFTMASDLGSTPVMTELNDSGSREIFYARYINWFVGWTPLIIAVGLISGVSWATIVYNVALSWAWVVSWLSGALVATSYKWGFFFFGVCSYLLLAISLLFTGMTTSKRLGIRNQYFAVAGYLVFLWMIYSIAWGIDDGGNVIEVTSGFIFFGILDLLTVPLFALGILVYSSTLDYRTLNLYFTQYGRVPQSGGLPEKETPVAAGAQQPV